MSDIVLGTWPLLMYNPHPGSKGQCDGDTAGSKIEGSNPAFLKCQYKLYRVCYPVSYLFLMSIFLISINNKIWGSLWYKSLSISWVLKNLSWDFPGRPLVRPSPSRDAAAAAAALLQSCLTLCDTIDGSPPGSSVPGILRARTPEWAAMSFSNACMHATSLQSCLTLCDPRDSSLPRSSVHRIL